MAGKTEWKTTFYKGRNCSDQRRSNQQLQCTLPQMASQTCTAGGSIKLYKLQERSACPTNGSTLQLELSHPRWLAQALGVPECYPAHSMKTTAPLF
jgi:hypothetical protein